MTIVTKKDLIDLMQLEAEKFNQNSFALSRKNFLYHINKKNILIVRSNLALEGYILLLNHLKRKSIRIYSIATKNEGKGFGRELITYAINLVNSEKKDLSLEVRSDNINAINFYKKYQFKITKTIHNYYPDKQDGLKMVRAYE